MYLILFRDSMDLKTLFSAGKIGSVQIKNRVVRSATFEKRAAKDGSVTDELIDFYAKLAQGGVGLIITGITAINPGGTIMPSQVRLYDDRFVEGQKKLVKIIHDYPEVKICVQLGHGGRQTINPKYETVAPSAVPYQGPNNLTINSRELKVAEIEEITKKFVNASKRAYDIGYDMVQLHAAHGYLLSNFLSPYTNKRKDEYGGTIKNRTKILVEIYNQLRDEVDKDFPIIIKLQMQDFIPEGLSFTEGKDIAKIVASTGYSAIEPSGGVGETLLGSKRSYPSLMIKKPDEENYFLPMAKELKGVIKDRPIILMGGIRNPISAEKILREGQADFISMGRPFIYEPDLPNRWKSGDLMPAYCISCNSCYFNMLTGPVNCYTKEKLDKKRLRKAKSN